MPSWIANLDVDVFITWSSRHSAHFHWFWSKHVFINISNLMTKTEFVILNFLRLHSKVNSDILWTQGKLPLFICCI